MRLFLFFISIVFFGANLYGDWNGKFEWYKPSGAPYFKLYMKIETGSNSGQYVEVSRSSLQSASSNVSQQFEKTFGMKLDQFLSQGVRGGSGDDVSMSEIYKSQQKIAPSHVGENSSDPDKIGQKTPPTKGFVGASVSTNVSASSSPRYQFDWRTTTKAPHSPVVLFFCDTQGNFNSCPNYGEVDKRKLRQGGDFEKSILNFLGMNSLTPFQFDYLSKKEWMNCQNISSAHQLTQKINSSLGGPQICPPVQNKNEIKFYSDKHHPANQWLGNFYLKDVTVPWGTFRCSEAAFQAAKFKHLANYKSKNSWQEQFQQYDGDQAFQKAKGFDQISGGLSGKDWGRMKEDIMYDVVKAKFTQHKDLRNKLIGTGSATLIEEIPFGFPNSGGWGQDPSGNGDNKLGKILMRVRDEMNRGVY